jgi:hypothetical protein
VKVGLLGWLQELRDVLLIGLCGRATPASCTAEPQLAATFLQLPFLSQDEMLGVDRVEVDAFVDQGGNGLG